MNYLYKLEIELDDEKIIADGVYSLESIYDGIRSIFAEEGISEIKTHDKTLVFASNKRSDYGAFGLVETELMDSDWFKTYVKKFFWYNRTYSNEHVENIIYENLKYTKKYGDC